MPSLGPMSTKKHKFCDTIEIMQILLISIFDVIPLSFLS